MILSINSNEKAYDLELFNIQRQDQINELISKFEALENILPAIESKKLLKDNWPKSSKVIGAQTKLENSVSIDIIKLQLAALAFNYSLILTSDDSEIRPKLLDFVDELIKL